MCFVKDCAVVAGDLVPENFIVGLRDDNVTLNGSLSAFGHSHHYLNTGSPLFPCFPRAVE